MKTIFVWQLKHIFTIFSRHTYLTQLKYCHKMIRVLLYRPRNNLKNTIQPKIPIHCQLHSPYHLPISPNALSSDCPCTHAIVPENECFSFQTSKLQTQHSKVQAEDETGTWIKQQMLCKQSMDSFQTWITLVQEHYTCCYTYAF